MVETGISIVVFLAFIFSVIDGAMMFWTYLTLEHGVTEAARFAATQQQLTDSSGNLMSRVDSIKATMRQQAKGVTIADSEFAFYNLTNDTADAGGGNDLIRITVTHPYRFLFLGMIPVLHAAGNQINLRVASTVMNEPPPGA